MRFREGCRSLLVTAASLLALLPAAAAAARSPSGDAPVAPFPEAKVVKRSVHELEAYWIPLGKLFGDGQAEKVQVVEGKWTHVTYSNPPKSSVIEIGRRYVQQLEAGGFEIVYDCRDGDCGQGGRKTNGDWWDPTYQRRYLVGRLDRPEGDLWVCVNVQAKSANVPGQHDVDVVEAKPEPEPEKIVRDETDAGWLERELSQTGHVALYTVGFDDKKLTVLPESEATLQAIAQLFARDPRRKLLIVVHTGDATQLKNGVQRSRREAAALVSTLVKKHGVAAARVIGDGVGPLAPVSASLSQEERSRNRRVELILPEVDPGLKADGATP